MKKPDPIKKITLVPFGGLGNRMRTISSFIAYAGEYNYALEIIWSQDDGLACSFHDLFEPLQAEHVKIRDISRWEQFVWDYPRKPNLWISSFFQRLLFDKRIYYPELIGIKEQLNPKEKLTERLQHGKSAYIASCSALAEEQKLYPFVPVAPIRKKIEEITSMFQPDNTIGIHIRRTDHIKAIESSPLELYIQKMSEEIKNNPEVVFYVASDSRTEKQALREAFPGKIITSTAEVKRDCKAGIEHALTEMYALAHTSKLYASRYSTFALVAGKMGAIEMVMF